MRAYSGIDGLVVATSTDVADDPLVSYLEGRGVGVIRGSLDDVLGRFIAAMEGFSPDVVVRLTADCPLVSPGVVDRVDHGVPRIGCRLRVQHAAAYLS